MRKYIVLLSVMILLLPACGGSENEPQDAGDAESCEDVADLTIDLMQNMLDEISGMSAAEFTGGEQLPESFQQFQTDAEELRTRGEELGCSTEEMQTLIQERVDQLEAEGPAAEMVLERLRNGSIFEQGQ